MMEPAPFTEQGYAWLLDMAAAKYRFVDAADIWNADSPAVVWRHDVDYSPHRALALARMEHERGLQAVYHVMLSSRYYNAFEPEIVAILREIAGMGHFLGAHVDLDVFGDDDDTVSSETVRARAAFERRTIETILERPLTSTSFHNYTLNTKRVAQEDTIEGLPNLSATRWFKELKYVSDSNGLWRYENAHDVLSADAYPRLMVLTHPVWWTPEDMSPFARVLRSVDGRARANRDIYLKVLGRDGRLTELGERIGAPADLIARQSD